MRKIYNEEEGIWHAQIFVAGEWETIGVSVDEAETDYVLEILEIWNRENHSQE